MPFANALHILRRTTGIGNADAPFAQIPRCRWEQPRINGPFHIGDLAEVKRRVEPLMRLHGVLLTKLAFENSATNCSRHPKSRLNVRPMPNTTGVRSRIDEQADLS